MRMKKKQFIATVVAVSGLFLLPGCREEVVNHTPSTLPQNPSNTYTFTYTPKIKDLALLKDTLEAFVVIDGQTHQMRLAHSHPITFAYDYKLPRGRNTAKYYYTATYKINNNQKVNERCIQSDLYDLALTNRYVTCMQSDRGLVGSRIPVLGRGFTEYDKVLVGNQEADTFFESHNALAFEIPALSANQCYPVEIISEEGKLPVGHLYVDAAEISVSKDEINLNPTERTLVVFQIDEEAPHEGLQLDVTTDIPDCIVMPEITIPGGSRTVSAFIEGAEVGQGSLFVSATGYNEKVIPVTIGSEL